MGMNPKKIIAKKIRVGVVQATPALFDLNKSIDIVCHWIEKGARSGCELLLFPESFIPGYPRGLHFEAVIGKRTDRGREQWLDYWANSVDTSTDILKKISAVIKKNKLMVALGVTEKEPLGGTLYCTLLYFGKDGELLGKHRKIKPTALERFVWGEGDGSTLTTLQTDMGIIGGLICWENMMPLARLSIYNKGVEIYLAPTADGRPSWQSTMQHIALEGRCFVMAGNQFVRKSDYPGNYLAELTGEPEIMCPGGSVIISPMGDILAGPLWNKEGLLVAELDFSLLIKSKLDFDVIGHYSRNDIFQFGVHGQPETIRAGRLPVSSDEEPFPDEGELVRERKDIEAEEEVDLGGEG
jgi:nitrilase